MFRCKRRAIFGSTKAAHLHTKVVVRLGNFAEATDINTELGRSSVIFATGI